MMRGATFYAREFGFLLTLSLSSAMHAQSPKASDAGSRLPPSADSDGPRRTTADRDPGVEFSDLPHPYLLIASSVMGGGYYPLTYRAEAGFDVESKRAAVEVGAAYDGGRQVNDGAQPNPKGHDRYLFTSGYFRLPRLFSGRTLAGFGWRCNELLTTKYTKRADRPQFGVGYDYLHVPCTGCHRDFSMRILVNWITSGSDWQNGVHGRKLASRSLRQGKKGIGHFRSGWACIDAIKRLPMMRSQRADREFSSFLDLGIKYRF